MCRKKILHLIPTLASGGTERQLVELSNHLNLEHFNPILAAVYAEAGSL